MPIRPLGTFERALLISDRYSPFNIVAVLELESPPSPQVIESALAKLQARHPLLRARIEDRQGAPYFVEMEEAPLPFSLVEQIDSRDWQAIVEDELSRCMDSSRGPLFRCLYRYGKDCAEVILSMQHTIADAASMANLMHELLTLCVDPSADLPRLEPSPAAETRFPSSMHGCRRPLQLTRYALLQMGDEIAYQVRTRGNRRPPIIFGGRACILSQSLDETLTEALSRQARKQKITLNSLVQAATMLAVNRKLYGGNRTYLRTFTFPDLRLYVTPPMGAEKMCACISMMRFTFPVAGDTSIWDLGRQVNQAFQASFQRGEKYAAHLMSENLMKMFLKVKTMRMGTTAVSYTGAPGVDSQYGSIHIRALHGFIANIDLGPEFSMQAGLFENELVMDMTFLDSDMDRVKAQSIASEIHSILEKTTE